MNLMKHLGITGADEEAAKLAKKAKVPTSKGTMTYYAATAYDVNNFESDFSEEVAFDAPPIGPNGFKLKSVTYTFDVIQ